MGVKSTGKYQTLAGFYPFYLGEHRKTGTRVMHFIGTLIFLGSLPLAFAIEEYRILIPAIALAYGNAWISHIFIEKNKPATFKYPFFSLISDFIFCFQLMTGKEKFKSD